MSRRVSLPAADDLFRGNRPMTAVPDEPEAAETADRCRRRPAQARAAGSGTTRR